MKLRLNTMQKFIARNSWLLLVVSLAACGQPTQPSTRTPTVLPTPQPVSTSRLQPTLSPSPTEIPLPKEPALLSIIGKGKVYATAWSLDHQVFAVSASDAVRVYQAKTYQVLAEFPPVAWGSPVEPMIFSPDGHKLAVISVADDILVYDLQNRQKISRVTAGISLMDFAFKADGSGFALSRHVYNNFADPGFSWVEVYDFQSDKPKYQFDYDQEFQSKDGGHYYAEIAFSPDGHWLSAADKQTGQVRTWDLTTGQLAALRQPHPQVTGIAYSPDGRWLVSGGNNYVLLWNARTGSLVRKLSGFSDTINSLSFSADSAWLVVETGSSSDQTTETFDVLTGQKIDVPSAPVISDEIQPFLASQGYMEISSLPHFSPNGHILAFQNGDKLVLWDLQSQRQKSVLIAKIDSGAAFSPDGKQLALPQPDGSIDLWDITNGRKVKNIPSRKATKVAFFADGKYMAVGGEQTVELWEVQSGLRLWQTYASGLSIRSVGFSPDGQTILAAASSGWAVLWLDFRDGQIRQTLHPNASDPNAATIAFQGRLLAAVKPGEYDHQAVSVWDLSTGQVLRDIDSYGTRSYDNYLVFSPDGRLIAVHNEAGTKVWSTVTGQELFVFPKEIHDLVFSPDQQIMVMSDEQGRLQIWDARALLDAPPLPAAASGLPPTAAPTPTGLPASSGLKNDCLAVQPALSPGRQLQGRLVMLGTGGNPDYLLDLRTGLQQPFPDNVRNLSVSPNGKWLAYTLRPDSQAEKSWLVFEDTAGKLRKYPMQDDWLFSQWLGNDWLSYSIQIEYNRVGLKISPTEIISPLTGPYRRLLSNYPNMQPYNGIAGSPYHYSGHSVEYDSSLRMVVYEKTDENYETSMVLYDRQNGKELVSLPDYSGEHYWNNPTWSVDGQFFIAALIKDYPPKTIPSQEEWFRINRDGSVEQLTHFEGLTQHVNLWGGSLSPDGKKFAFYLIGQTYADQNLAVLDLDSKLITYTCMRSGRPTWSPDSSYLLVQEEYEQNASRMILIDLANGQAEQITDDNRAVPAGWLEAP